MSPRPKKCGIYAIYNTISGRIYIGHSGGINVRLGQHRSKLQGGKHGNRHLQNAWNLYGEEAFEFSTIEECPIDQLLIREQHYIDLYPKNYNIAKVAGSSLGIKRSSETKAKISVSMTGREIGPETRAKNGAANKRRVVTPETRERPRQAFTGREFTPEAKANMSEAAKGRRATPEAKENMRVAALAREARKREAKEASDG